MSRPRCRVCKQEGTGQVRRPKHLSPVCLGKVGSLDSRDSLGDWASLGRGGRGHSAFGPWAPPCISGGRRCWAALARRPGAAPYPRLLLAAPGGGAHGYWSHSPEGAGLRFEQSPDRTPCPSPVPRAAPVADKSLYLLATPFRCYIFFPVSFPF